MSPILHLARGENQRLAYKRVEGRGPTVVWLGGFHSDMEGAKALALHNWAERTGRSFLRFDYFGHGASTGVFEDGLIGLWRDDGLAVVDQLTQGPLVLVGSSMGGWLACLVALARPERIAGMVLIAPAIDFTQALIEPQLSQEARAALKRDGIWLRPSTYDAGGYGVSAGLLEEGRRWSLLPGPIRIPILQGGADPDVPWGHALRLIEALDAQDLVFILVKDGDHRLSRPEDLERIIQAAESLAGLGPPGR